VGRLAFENGFQLFFQGVGAVPCVAPNADDAACHRQVLSDDEQTPSLRMIAPISPGLLHHLGAGARWSTRLGRVLDFLHHCLGLIVGCHTCLVAH